jgi:hypothetical protein
LGNQIYEGGLNKIPVALGMSINLVYWVEGMMEKVKVISKILLEFLPFVL